MKPCKFCQGIGKINDTDFLFEGHFCVNKEHIIKLIKEAMTTNLNLHGDRMLEPEEVIFHYLNKSGCLNWSDK